ncbi:N(5)-(carboxyethyl)ornithine synthase [Paenibacillus sp.]
MGKRTMGLLISHKNNEKRRAILPEDVKLLRNPDMLYFETGYGDSVNYTDQDYIDAGVHVVSREEAMKCDIITDVKLGDADYLDQLDDGKILFGWAHAAQGISFTNKCLEKNFTVIAWEEVFEDGRYIFYRNREVAGEAAVLQAFCHYGKMPYECRVAIIGNGQTAKGAMRILHGLGAKVDVYGRKLEKLFLQKMYDYDVVVNCVMWDISRKDRLIYKEDLKKFKPHTMIIDVSCDPYLEIETSHPTTISDPVYAVDGVIHYCVDNTPAMFPLTVTKVLSEGNVRIFDAVIEGALSSALDEAMVIENGHIRNKNIWNFREARGLECK